MSVLRKIMNNCVRNCNDISDKLGKFSKWESARSIVMKGKLVMLSNKIEDWNNYWKIAIKLAIKLNEN